jgi:hypothetical protein
MTQVEDVQKTCYKTCITMLLWKMIIIFKKHVFNPPWDMATHIVTHNELKNAINYYIINQAFTKYNHEWYIILALTCIKNNLKMIFDSQSNKPLQHIKVIS